MTNEEIIEEIYMAAHRYGVFGEFINDVTKRQQLKPKSDKYNTVEEVYREYRNSGLIASGREEILTPLKRQ